VFKSNSGAKVKHKDECLKMMIDQSKQKDFRTNHAKFENIILIRKFHELVENIYSNEHVQTWKIFVQKNMCKRKQYPVA